MMRYPISEKYETETVMKRIMGPNPMKLQEELLMGHRLPRGGRIMDLGSGMGVTSMLLAKEYGFTVYAVDLWSDPTDNMGFFMQMGLDGDRAVPIHGDAAGLPFAHGFFHGVVSVDSYHYFGRDPGYLEEKLLPFVKPGGYIYISVPGMRRDCHENLPEELLLSWTPEDLDSLHDAPYWRRLLSGARGVEILSIHEMESNGEVWADWLKQDNPYALGDRKAMEAGGGKYLNFIAMVLQKTR